MKSRIILILSVMCLGVLTSQAQSTINFTAGIGERDVLLDLGVPLPNGNQVSIGYFTPGFDVMANGTDFAGLLGAWNELGGSAIKTIFGEPGRFAGTLYNTDSRFDDQKVWMWIYKTTGDTAPTAGYDNVVSYGLFSSTQPNWAFPAQDASPLFSTASVNSSEVNQAAFGFFDPNHLFLLPVPEPSAWILGTIGIGALLLFRLRERSHTSWNPAND